MEKSVMKKIGATAVAAAPVVAASLAVAGTGGSEFAAIVTTLTDWLEGGLGQLFALGALIVGLGIGMIQQSIMAVVVGVGFALAVFYGPALLTGIIGSGLPF